MPAAAVGLTPPLAAGMKFGLGMAINDGDEKAPGQGGWGGLGAHSIVFLKTPSETALITLGTNLPTTDLVFLSAINPTIDSFSFRATDKGASIVDTNSAKLSIDDQTVTLTAGAKTVDSVDFTYRRPAPFSPGSGHTYRIEVKDTIGTTVTDTGTFTTPAYALLTAADKVTADTAKRGFIWRVHQNDAFTATSISRALDQLAGSLGENFADTNAQGVALGPGTPGANNRLPIQFEIATVINLNEDAATQQNGDIVPDDQMPGIPGLGATGQTDGIAAEITTYLEVPAGKYTLIVNSDDGFRTTAGNVNDVFQAKFAGEYNGGRAAGDTAYIVYALEAGVYPFKTVWLEGGSGSSIEWKLQKTDGTEVLLNDDANGGWKAYRAATGASPTVISSVSPAVNALKVQGTDPIQVVITEGATSAVFTDYGVTRGVDITPAKQLRASGGIYRAVMKDARSPIAYGYADTLAVYFNQSPLFQVDTSTDVPEDQDPDLTAQQARMRPRVVLSFHQKRDSLRLSGLLVNGEELAGRPAVLDAPVGQGHVVLFAIRPFWRWETQGSFALVFNTIMNWNDLGVAWPTLPKPTPRAVAAPDEGP